MRPTLLRLRSKLPSLAAPPAGGRGIPAAIATVLLVTSTSAQARETVDASAPSDIAVTVYRDPNRGLGDAINPDWPQGFAMISETRQVTLPPGESTIRFTGVSEGMVAVSAIVTGLPGGTIEKNRNADLLSPAALVDGTLGNRVTITRTNPGTGEAESEEAIVRTRADGGLVLQTAEGYEAVRCSGLPEKLTFDHVPEGLSPQPVFTIDTRDETGGTFQITLTYLSWGFDWQANYVATLDEGGGSDDVGLGLVSWLTVLNDNGQSFDNAHLMAVAGTLNLVSDLQGLATPPLARPLSLTCYPLGSSLAGSPENYPYPPPPPPAPPLMMTPQAMYRMEVADEASIVVTGSRIAMVATEEDLGDLKAYRVPEPVDVRAKGMKQIAFLDRDDVEGRFLYRTDCAPYATSEDPSAALILFATTNDDDHGLGVALPQGNLALFEPASAGELLVAEEPLRDFARGQDVELQVGESAQVFARCERLTREGDWEGPSRMRLTLTNANPHPVTMRVRLGGAAQWVVEGQRSRVKDGLRIAEIDLPANGSRQVEWVVRPVS